MENQSSETIKKFASFTTLSGEQTQLIYNKRYKKGAVLFKQGENSRDLYILNSGVLEVLVDGSPVAQIDQRGVFFGEMASILHEARNATVRVKVECNCLVIPAGFVNKVLFTKPEIGLSLIKLLARRLKETTRNLTMMQKMYFSLKQEFLKKQDAAETGAGKSPYDIMIELDLIT
ncbi:MAG TPA: hypothetical protein DC049_06420, partial [Spirochaetia bacterium]|nr:hypothetical protein [Spirochaetia bacterium]